MIEMIEPPEDQTVAFEYTNHRKERATRHVVPKYLWWGTTKWHPNEGWLLHALDMDKGEHRDFAWGSIHGHEAHEAILRTTRISGPVDEAAIKANVNYALRVLEFHTHLVRGGHAELARDFVDMGLMSWPWRQPTA